MKKKIIYILILCVIVFNIIIYVSKYKISKNVENNMENDDKYEEEIMNEIIDRTDITGDKEIYQINEEYDGRKTVEIKPTVQFQTVLAGIIKQAKPNENEIEEILKTKPNKNGIWVSSNSRNEFMNLLNSLSPECYYINEEGYINITKKSNNEILSKLDEIIEEKNELIFIDMSGKCYVRDDVSGEIVEYPFDEMDQYQILEKYTFKNQKIIIITRNLQNRISNQQIMDSIIENLK